MGKTKEPDDTAPETPETPETPPEPPAPEPRRRKARTAPPPPPPEDDDPDDVVLDLDERVTALEAYKMKRKAKEEEGNEGGYPWIWIAAGVATLAVLLLVDRFKDRIPFLAKKAPTP